MYRVTRTTLRGQFEDDRCFLDWVASFPTANARVVDWRDDPTNNGGPNDRRFYVWFHDVEMKTPICPRGAVLELITKDKKNGWDTEAEARAVMLAQLGQAAAIQQKVDASVAEATSVKKIVGSMAGDAAQAVQDVATGEAFGVAGKVAAGAALLAGGLFVFKLLRKG